MVLCGPLCLLCVLCVQERTCHDCVHVGGAKVRSPLYNTEPTEDTQRATETEKTELLARRGSLSMGRAQCEEILFGVDVDQRAGVFHIHALRRIARHEPS